MYESYFEMVRKLSTLPMLWQTHLDDCNMWPTGNSLRL